MTLTWPDTLPRPERKSFAIRPQEARRKRKLETGPPGYRRRFSSVSRTVSLSVLLTRNERAIFDRFFHEDCAEGTHPFRMPDPTTEGWPILTASGAPLLGADGAALLMSGSWLCLWGDELPHETLEGLEFRKTFQVVVMP